MSANAHLQRGNLLRGVAWLVAGVGAATLVTVLVATRGGKIRNDLGEDLKGAGEQIKASLPAIPRLADLPAVPGVDAGSGEETAAAEPAAAPSGARPPDPTGAVDPEPPGPDGAPSGSGGEARAAEPGKAAAPEAKRTPAAPAYTVQNPPPVARARHTVVKGDTLYSLAETYYEDGSLWRLIAEANSLQNPAELREGAEIVIPGR
jgi:5'-nucleotidase